MEPNPDTSRIIVDYQISNSEPSPMGDKRLDESISVIFENGDQDMDRVVYVATRLIEEIKGAI